MTLLLLGDGAPWVRAFLETRAASPARTMPTVLVVEGSPTRELLVSLQADPVDALVLANYLPFTDGSSTADLPPVEAVRHEAQRAILALELARHAARTLVLARSNADLWSTSLARLQADLVGGPPEQHPPFSCLPAVAGGPAPAALPDTPLVTSYVDPLFAAIAQATPLELVWPREAFLDGDEPGSSLPATVEVAGRARILAYGPYLPLPAGNWHATAFLGFSPDIGRMPFIIEADAGGTVSRGFFEVERGGIFSLGLEFEVVDAMHPVELRLISQDSALEGQLALIEVRLRQAPNA